MIVSLNDLIKKYGAERINIAIQPLYVADGEEPSDPLSFVINAAINDTELWNELSDDEKNELYIAHLDLHFETKDLLHSIFDLNEPDGGFEIPE